VVCALSDTLAPMLVGRALQGLAMGFIPVAIALVREVVPPGMAASATAAVSATMGVGAAIGLPLSAWIVESGDWHTLFWVGVGLSAVVLLLVVVVVPHVHDAQPGSLDIVGTIGLTVGLVTLLVGLTKANEWGWGDVRTLGAIGGGLAVLVLWGLVELFVVPDPLVDLRTTARPAVLLTNLAALAIGFGMMAQSIVMPRLLEMPEATGYGLGQSMLEAGLWMAPGGLMMMVFAPISARLIGGAGAKLTLMLGGTVLGAGYLVAFFLMDSPLQILVASCVITAGVGIGYAAMPTLILNAVPLREAGAAVGLNSLMRSVGTTAASAAMVTMLTSDTMDRAGLVPTRDAFQLCFVAGTLAAFVGVLLVALLPRAVRSAPAAAAVEDHELVSAAQ
jgi:MFS family permease